MGKTVFMFPGQGAQYVGMGKELYDNYEKAREIFDIASKATGLDIAALCFEENDKLNITEYTQIAMLTVEAAIYAVMEEKGLKCDYTAGLSLGEYGALIASKVLSYEDAFKVVRKRGIFMQEAVPTGGAMAAVLAMDADKIEEVCKNTEGYVAIANYNCPGQIVITGEEAAVLKASETLKELGARKVVPLNVSGPFHSDMLIPAGERLGEVLDEATINDIEVPYICNVNATAVTDKAEVRDLLVKQICSSVRWQQSVELLIEEGCDTFVEIGPGKTLSGFMKKINKDMTVYHIEKLEELDAYVNR